MTDADREMLARIRERVNIPPGVISNSIFPLCLVADLLALIDRQEAEIEALKSTHREVYNRLNGPRIDVLGFYE